MKLFGESPLKATLRIQESIIKQQAARIQELEGQLNVGRDNERKHELELVEALLHRKPQPPKAPLPLGKFTVQSRSNP